MLCRDMALDQVKHSPSRANQVVYLCCSYYSSARLHSLSHSGFVNLLVDSPVILNYLW
jgi:hypothetical protein